MSTGRLGAGDTAIQPTIFDAKGDLLTATAGDTPARIAVGSNGQALLADSSTATGLKWGAVGKVLQVVQDTSTTQESTTSESYVDTDLSQAITPSANTSKILVIAQIGAGTAKNSTTVTEAMYNIVRTSTQLGETRLRLAAASANLSVSGVQTLVYLDSPNTTSSTTYKVQFKANEASNTAYKSISSTLSSLTLIEIGA